MLLRDFQVLDRFDYSDLLHCFDYDPTYRRDMIIRAAFFWAEREEEMLKLGFVGFN